MCLIDSIQRHLFIPRLKPCQLVFPSTHRSSPPALPAKPSTVVQSVKSFQAPNCRYSKCATQLNCSLRACQESPACQLFTWLDRHRIASLHPWFFGAQYTRRASSVLEPSQVLAFLLGAYVAPTHLCELGPASVESSPVSGTAGCDRLRMHLPVICSKRGSAPVAKLNLAPAPVPVFVHAMPTLPLSRPPFCRQKEAVCSFYGLKPRQFKCEWRCFLLCCWQSARVHLCWILTSSFCRNLS